MPINLGLIKSLETKSIMVDSRETSLSSNVVEAIRSGCRNVQRSLIMVNLSEIFSGWYALETRVIGAKVQFGVWV